MSLMTTSEPAFRVIDPSDGTVVREYDAATDADIEDSLSRADAGYQRWRNEPVADRAAALARAAAVFRERAEELAGLAHREMGKSVRSGRNEVNLVADIFDYYATEGPSLLADREFRPASGGRAVIVRQPVGVLLGIMPWNYPYYQVARFAAPNLMLGNTVLVKHAPNCPSSALAIAEVLRRAGLPDGGYVNVFASNEQVAAIIADDRVRGVSLTGSERAGAAVAEVAGRHLKKVVLELGGSDPLLVLDADDPAAIARTAYSARMANVGQACNSPKRMIVADGVYEPFLESVVGLARDSATSGRLAPLSSRAAAEAVHAQIRQAVADGAVLHTGGELSEKGAYLTPAVLTGVTPAMALWSQEVFGPAIVVHRVADADEAVAVANSTPYGLGAAVFAADADLARHVADRLECGMVYVNTVEDSEADLPFGGVKRSGFGRELGPYGVEEFANHKLIRLRD